jgi:nucleoside-diphosphate-sugar epimerase
MSETMSDVQPSKTQLTHQTVLVTGASGFIGTHLCQRLRQAGATVHALCRYSAPQVREPLSANLHWHLADVTDITTVRSILQNIQPAVIFHLAGQATAARSLNYVLPTFHSNLTATVNLLTATTELGCGRIILAGSLEEPAADESTPTPSSPYAAAKFASSAYARMFHELYQTAVVLTRIFMVYGPGQRNLQKLIPYVTVSLLSGKVPHLSSGQRLIDWIYIDDLVQGLMAIAQTPHLEGQTVELGSGQMTSVYSVVQQLVALTGSEIEPVFGILADRPLEQLRQANIAATSTQLAWQPTTSLTDGLVQTVDWYRQWLAMAQSSNIQDILEPMK